MTLSCVAPVGWRGRNTNTLFTPVLHELCVPSVSVDTLTSWVTENTTPLWENVFKNTPGTRIRRRTRFYYYHSESRVSSELISLSEMKVWCFSESSLQHHFWLCSSVVNVHDTTFNKNMFLHPPDAFIRITHFHFFFFHSCIVSVAVRCCCCFCLLSVIGENKWHALDWCWMLTKIRLQRVWMMRPEWTDINIYIRIWRIVWKKMMLQ